ncbi:xanthine dehydrogenase family protein molybdopterin-binding subunit [Mucilaginibacter sp. RS28]|uniref:Xanthine dehydrogenase family protein molybdopterin-binding subunit n=1 Tax=Mucilaginibacter straminoryzae TaxID=2932774 RepID=A0A9X2BA04_9SPHI|nr:xanthine dehydrogenase family protein molybdopterin-binding subunit [Mucilaginibacter straminoryzae]MCJ8208262.1 xanthine dehydrogenase family protein molybdopterin-binding subunit [Mucilaginibacter straminoryzae]
MKQQQDPNKAAYTEGISRVDGRLKVTGAAKYSAEYNQGNMAYAVFANSTITKGTIKAIDTKAAERAPGVLKVITYQNAPELPGYQTGKDPSKPPAGGGPLRLFVDNTVKYNGQPVAMVVADSFERATYAASLIKATYAEESFQTDVTKNLDKARRPGGVRTEDYKRGNPDEWKNAEVKFEAEYVVPIEVHNPMELHAIIANWTADDKVEVYAKTQGVKSTQNAIAQAFKLPKENVQVTTKFVGGAFGNALRTWPHETAAVMAAKLVKRPLKLVLTREMQFNSVGYRPHTLQKISIGATKDGKLTGLIHEATGQTSSFEEFTEGTVNMSRFMYACPNVGTIYKVAPTDTNTPTWMRGPGEATGAFALESAIDELAHQLDMDPIELRLRNYAETDPENGKPFSTKFLKEAYEMGADKIGWKNRPSKPGTLKEDGWLVGYGMGSGVFGAHRGSATVKATMQANGTLLLQTAVTDIGVGTGTAMTAIASEAFGIPSERIKFELGDSSLPPSPTQGGSAITATVGSAVHDACLALKEKFQQLIGNGGADQPDYVKVLKDKGLPQLDVTITSSPSSEARKYSSYSYSVHFVQVKVHPATGVTRVTKVVSVADSGKIASPKTARSQIVGGAIGGIGMALMEEGVIDHRYGRYVNADLAGYHVPVHADIPQIDTIFVNKPDFVVDPMGVKGMGEIALIGMSAAVANAIFNATGKRVRELPITPDKLMA